MGICIKVTIDTNHVFDIENMIYLILMSKQGYRIIICVDDMIRDDRKNKLDVPNISHQIAFLKQFGVIIDRIIRHSEYYALSKLYLDRLIDLGAHKLKSTTFESEYVVVLDNQVVSMNDNIIPEFYDMIIDYVLNIDFSYHPNVEKSQNTINLTDVAKLLRMSQSKALIGIDNAIGRCQIHLLNPSSFDILRNIEYNLVDIMNIQADLHRICNDILERFESNIINIDRHIRYIDKNNYQRILVDPISIDLNGVATSINIDNQNICINDRIYVENSLKNTIDKMSTPLKFRLRFGTNIIIQKNNNRLVGIIDNKPKRKKFKAVNWLPESNNLYRFVTESGNTIYYFPDTVSRDMPSIVRYNNQLMYVTPECLNMNEDKQIDLTDWFSLPDLPNLKEDNTIKTGRYRIYPINKNDNNFIIYEN